MNKDKAQGKTITLYLRFCSSRTQLTVCFPAVNQFIFQFFQHTMFNSEVTFLVVEMIVFIFFYVNNSLGKETNSVNMI